MENAIYSMVKNVGSQMAVSLMYIRYLQKWMEINSQLLLSKEEPRVLHKDRKSTRWVSKALQQFSYISRIAKCLLRMCLGKLAKDTKLLLTYSILED